MLHLPRAAIYTQFCSLPIAVVPTNVAAYPSYPLLLSPTQCYCSFSPLLLLSPRLLIPPTPLPVSHPSAAAPILLCCSFQTFLLPSSPMLLFLVLPHTQCCCFPLPHAALFPFVLSTLNSAATIPVLLSTPRNAITPSAVDPT